MQSRILSIALVAIASIVVVPLAGFAQSGVVQGDVRQEIKRKRFLVLPPPPAETVRQDAERVIEELEAKQRHEALMRPSVTPPRSRPELDPSIVSGIQGQQVDRALGAVRR